MINLPKEKISQIIELNEDLIENNERLAEENNKTFKQNNIKSFDIVGAIGAGKTAILESITSILAKDKRILVINGDILTDVDFKAMHAFHQEHNADLTVGVRQYDLQVPYGVIETQGVQVKQLDEKPIYSFFVNAGIYLLEPDVRQFIPNGEKYDMTELIERLIIDGRPVISFPIIEYWLDIGELGDYRRAQEDLENGRMKY